MKIVINNKSKNEEIISFDNLDIINENIKKISSIEGNLEVKIFAINETINSHQLSKIKNNFDRVKISNLRIYSSNRDTILSGKSLKVDSTFLREQDVKNKLILHDSIKFLSTLFLIKIFSISLTSKNNKFHHPVLSSEHTKIVSLIQKG